jgi:hypothetical protein
MRGNDLDIESVVRQSTKEEKGHFRSRYYHDAYLPM